MKEYQIRFQTLEGHSIQNAKGRTAGDAIGRALFNLTKKGVVIDYVVEWKEVGS